MDEHSATNDPPLWVHFTCPDCSARLARLVRVDACQPLRCFECEARRIRRISDRLLAQVFAGPSGESPLPPRG